MLVNPVLLLFGAVFVVLDGARAVRNGFCTVFEPFKVTPENAKFQIGGPFSLHNPDCFSIRPESVQELVAMQWSLTHWNQNPDNAEFKLGMFAADTCSRPKEAVSQAVNFLKDSGFYEASECGSSEKPALLGLMVPNDGPSAESVASSLTTAAAVQVISYSTQSAEGLAGKGLPMTISTAPTVLEYAEAAISILQHLDSNMVSVIIGGDISESTRQRLETSLRGSGVVVREMISNTDAYLVRKIIDSKSNIFLLLTTKHELLTLFRMRGMAGVEKLFITIPIDGKVMTTFDAKNLLPGPSDANVILLQESSPAIPEFQDYFLHILRNNYKSYSLLAAYMQQVYNCTLTGRAGYLPCDQLSQDQMASSYAQAEGVEAAVLSTYALAALGKHVSSAEECARNGPDCTRYIARQDPFEISYYFGDYDPNVFNGYTLTFSKEQDSISVAKGLLIQGVQLLHSRESGLMLHKVIEYATGDTPKVFGTNFHWLSPQKIKSRCSAFIPECQMCSRVKDVSSGRYSLSLPRSYDLYLVGLFDLHEGLSCRETVKEPGKITLPMAFLHTLWTVKQRYSELGILEGVDLGGLVVDSCSMGPIGMQSVMETAENCLRLHTPATNVTISPASIVGYLSGAALNTHTAVRELFTTANGLSRPLISLNQDYGFSSNLYNDFSLLPDFSMQAKALVQLLDRLDWSFVTVVLSKNDPNSLKAFEAFKSAARSRNICVAELVTIDQKVLQSVDKPQSVSTSVSVIFATTKDAQLYMENRPKDTVNILSGPARGSTIPGTISVLPRQLVREEFAEWVKTITPSRFPEPWYQKYVREIFNCDELPCSGEEMLPSEQFGDFMEAGYLSQTVENLIFAIDAAYKALCPDQNGLCEGFFLNGNREIMHMLRNVERQTVFDVFNVRVAGSETANVLIGNWSAEWGLNLDSNPMFYDSSQQPTALPQSSCKPPLCQCYLDKDFFLKPLQETTHARVPEDASLFSAFEDPVVASVQQRGAGSDFGLKVKKGMWREQKWTYVFIALVSILLLGAVGVLILVSTKLLLGQVKGNQSLGLCLLCGVILVYITGFFFIFDACEIMCKVRYTLHSFAYSVCFGVMVAKAMQLRNAETLGFNGHISYWNYWLLLIFIVGVQLAMNLQWLLTGQPAVQHVLDGRGGDAVARCAWSRREFLLSHGYVIIVMLLAAVLAVANRGVKRNYKETKWLTMTTVLCVPIWLAWMVTYALVPEPFHDAVVVMELVVCGTVIICFMFGPKLYIILSYEAVQVPVSDYPSAGGKGGAVSPSGDTLASSGLQFYDQVPPLASPTSSNASTKSTQLSSGENSPVLHGARKKKGRRSTSSTLDRDCSNSTRDPVDPTGLGSRAPPYAVTPVHRMNPMFKD